MDEEEEEHPKELEPEQIIIVSELDSNLTNEALKTS